MRATTSSLVNAGSTATASPPRSRRDDRVEPEHLHLRHLVVLEQGADGPEPHELAQHRVARPGVERSTPSGAFSSLRIAFACSRTARIDLLGERIVDARPAGERPELDDVGHPIDEGDERQPLRRLGGRLARRVPRLYGCRLTRHRRRTRLRPARRRRRGRRHHALGGREARGARPMLGPLRHPGSCRKPRDGRSRHLRRAFTVGIALERIVTELRGRRRRRRPGRHRARRRRNGERRQRSRHARRQVRRRRWRGERRLRLRERLDRHLRGGRRLERGRSRACGELALRRDAVESSASEPAPRLEAQHEVADVDLVALADDRRLGDLASVDVGPVGALRDPDDEAAVTEEQARVVLRDVALRQHQVVALHAVRRR